MIILIPSESRLDLYSLCRKTMKQKCVGRVNSIWILIGKLLILKQWQNHRFVWRSNKGGTFFGIAIWHYLKTLKIRQYLQSVLQHPSKRKVKSLKHFQRAIKRQNYWKSFIVSKWDISNKLVGWTILAHIKAVKCSTYLSFSTWHSILDTLSLWPIWFYMGQIKCLVINCKAISRFEKANALKCSEKGHRRYPSHFYLGDKVWTKYGVIIYHHVSMHIEAIS